MWGHNIELVFGEEIREKIFDILAREVSIMLVSPEYPESEKFAYWVFALECYLAGIIPEKDYMYVFRNIYPDDFYREWKAGVFDSDKPGKESSKAGFIQSKQSIRTS